MKRVTKGAAIFLGGFILTVATAAGVVILRTDPRLENNLRGQTGSGGDPGGRCPPGERRAGFTSMTDDEMRALWACLQTLPALETTTE